MKTKQILRETMRTKRKQLRASEIESASAKTCESVLDLITNAGAKTVACYLSVNKEVDCMPLIEHLLATGRRVAVPKKIDEQWQSVEYSQEDFSKNKKYGEEGTVVIDPKTIDAVICPGLAFDKRGNRLGYGGGAYDGMLSKVRPDALKIGVCYDFQLVEHMPIEKHDIRMNMLVTETRTIKPCATRKSHL